MAWPSPPMGMLRACSDVVATNSGKLENRKHSFQFSRMTDVVYPGDGAWPLTGRIRVSGLGALAEEMAEG